MTLEGMINEMRKKGKMYKIRKREGELIYDVRRKERKKEANYLPLRWKFFVNM